MQSCLSMGWDSTTVTFAAQIEFFSWTHRVIAVDLRGHGASDNGKPEYAMPVFAEDIAWLCAQLNLVKPVFVGHSMGGNVALTLAALHPYVPASILLIDSLLFPPHDMAAMLRQVGEALKGPTPTISTSRSFKGGRREIEMCWPSGF